MYVPATLANLTNDERLLLPLSAWLNGRYQDHPGFGDMVPLDVDTDRDMLTLISDVCADSDDRDIQWTGIEARARLAALDADVDVRSDPDGAAADLDDWLAHTCADGKVIMASNRDGKIIRHLAVIGKPHVASDPYGRHEQAQSFLSYHAPYENESRWSRSGSAVAFATTKNEADTAPMAVEITSDMFVPATAEAILADAADTAADDAIRAMAGTEVLASDNSRYIVTSGVDAHPAPSRAASVKRTKSNRQARVTVPTMPLVRVIDLDRPIIRRADGYGEWYHWAFPAALTPRTYRNGVDELIILPPTHRSILDTLATTRALGGAGDVIESKTSGSIVLCKGRSGVGKTLTAEIYAEQIQRPLMHVKARDLGIHPESVDAALTALLRIAQTYDLVLLLDECDVYLRERGNDLSQNGVVSEFLRKLEYYDGFVVLTTNRPDDIDDAVLQRATAILAYDLPDADGIKKVWHLMSRTLDYRISEDLIATLPDVFAGITPRDIKHIVAAARRISHTKPETDTFDAIIEGAAWRGINRTDKD